MAVHQRINPPGLFDASAMAYSQVQRSVGGTFVQVAGQAALDASLNVIGAGDFSAQVDAALGNLAIALEAAGARRSDVNLVRLYVVGVSPERIPVLQTALRAFFGSELPPGTLVGVAALAMPELLFEIEATAVV